MCIRDSPHARFEVPDLGDYAAEDWPEEAKIPVMTYAQLQFIKAEAAYRAGDKATALAAYRNAIIAHINWVNERNLDNSQSPLQITAAERDADTSAVLQRHDGAFAFQAN